MHTTRRKPPTLLDIHHRILLLIFPAAWHSHYCVNFIPYPTVKTCINILHRCGAKIVPLLLVIYYIAQDIAETVKLFLLSVCNTTVMCMCCFNKANIGNIMEFIYYYYYCENILCLQCLTVGWASGRASGLWVMRCWWSYLSGARRRLFAYGPADAIASQNPIISGLI